MILAAALSAALAMQVAPPMTPEQMLNSVSLCVAALEYPDAHGEDTAEALAAWKGALARVPGSDAASQAAAVAEQRKMFEDTAARAGSNGAEVARAIGILAPNCLSADAGARLAARLADPSGGA